MNTRSGEQAYTLYKVPHFTLIPKTLRHP